MWNWLNDLIIFSQINDIVVRDKLDIYSICLVLVNELLKLRFLVIWSKVFLESKVLDIKQLLLQS